MSMERISRVPGVWVSDVPRSVSRAGLLCQQGLAIRKEICPAVCGALPTLLAADAQYQKLPRGRSREIYAWWILVCSLRAWNGSIISRHGNDARRSDLLQTGVKTMAISRAEGGNRCPMNTRKPIPA